MITKFTDPYKAVSLEEKGSIFAEFNKYDLELIIAGLEAKIQKLKRASRDIDNNPNNEGQIHWQEKSTQVHREMRYIGDMIAELKK